MNECCQENRFFAKSSGESEQYKTPVRILWIISVIQKPSFRAVMKSFACLVIVVAVVGVKALTEEQLKKADSYATDCLQKFSSLSREAVDKLRSGAFSDVNQDTKCFTKCFLERSGFLDSEGNLLTDYAIERLSLDREKSKVETLVQKCSVKKDDPCETAFRAFECFHNGKASLY
ncbi:general odorant-binding protein 56d-like [Malaya genurostris]|uniref:general odorant-binding protein 56d-like n=1 Tax=Malaya genurostris TaxID=325434 RepID=UPI0026F3FE30|nr:general odorant-binding protein 56d-like [Malaya genurostris]XP_058465114.1 general odorant-binding protein 56d-like [Malaya genurostris]